MAKLGSGFDIVRKAKLERVLAAGGEASKVVFSAWQNLAQNYASVRSSIVSF